MTTTAPPGRLSPLWLAANDVLGAPSATFAPFSALLMVSVTISNSLFQSVRYAGAILAGVALTAALVPLLGLTMAAFVLLIDELSELADARDLDQGRDAPIYTGLVTEARRLIEVYGQAREELSPSDPPDRVTHGDESSASHR